METPRHSFATMKLPALTLQARLSDEGPMLLAADGAGRFKGSVPLGDVAAIRQLQGNDGPWSICKCGERGNMIVLAWCDLQQVKAIARMFGIVGPDPTVKKHFYGSDAWDGLVRMVMVDPDAARNWCGYDPYAEGWYGAAVYAASRLASS